MITIIAPVGSLGLDGKNVAFEVILSMTDTSLVITGSAPSRGIGLILKGYAPELQASIKHLPSEEVLMFSGKSVVAFHEHFREGSESSLVLTGSAPTITVDHMTLPAVATLDLDSDSYSIIAPDHRLALPLRKPLVLFGEAPIIHDADDPIIGPSKGMGAFAGQDVTIDQSGVFTKIPAVGTLSLAGQAPTLVRGTVIAAGGAGALVLDGKGVTADLGDVMLPAAGALAFTSYLPYIAPADLTLTLAGQSVDISTSETALPAATVLTFTERTPLVETLGIKAVPSDDVMLLGYAPTFVLSSFIRDGKGGIINLTVDRDLVSIAAPKIIIV